VLAVIQQDQELLTRQVTCHIGHSERGGYLARNQVAVRQALEVDEPNAIAKVAAKTSGDLEREPRFASAGGAGDRHQARPAEQRTH
jgi:hypothetical protein